VTHGSEPECPSSRTLFSLAPSSEPVFSSGRCLESLRSANETQRTTAPRYPRTDAAKCWLAVVVSFGILVSTVLSQARTTSTARWGQPPGALSTSHSMHPEATVKALGVEDKLGAPIRQCRYRSVRQAGRVTERRAPMSGSRDPRVHPGRAIREHRPPLSDIVADRAGDVLSARLLRGDPGPRRRRNTARCCGPSGEHVGRTRGRVAGHAGDRERALRFWR